MTTVQLQQALRARGLYSGAIDGDYGLKTRAAVKAFQSAEGLVVDGVAGPITKARLGALLEVEPAGPIDPVDERIIAAVHRSLQPLVRSLLHLAFAEGIDLTLTQGLRTAAYQGELYAQGRTKPGPLVTYAPPGYSWHQFGLAVDVAIDGDPGPRIRPEWPRNMSLWRRIGAIGEELGLEWGGNWERTDLPHFQRIGGLTLAQARAGQRPADPDGGTP